MTNLLRASKVNKSFFHPKELSILKNISFELEYGQTLAIMGASGEGKSTLLHILGTLDNLSSGELFFKNKSFSYYSPYELKNNHFGFIFQSFHLFEEDSVFENIILPARIMRKSIKKGSDIYQRVETLICSVHLEKHINTPVKFLSGGERQRVAIARAFCNDPELIFADEPTGNLDYKTSAEIHSLLLSQVKAFNKGLIVVTHDKELAGMCDKAYTLENGLLSPLSTLV